MHRLQASSILHHEKVLKNQLRSKNCKTCNEEDGFHHSQNFVTSRWGQQIFVITYSIEKEFSMGL